ncbi:Aminomethyltransferase [Candidatus Promineifilum breve]|uniref:Serine hydroxymethyltransferase n=1 Tax=Candidatus Promineifilum breve TaxID=1806508 RepID=A0A170PH42_9CHLR|nr:glycine cleavage system aminomethyltransferase GcvT [Candidatus Promineifilum breve]CUS04107.2 Aminomethyltransferase [Candidatus Promineifilum breve]
MSDDFIFRGSVAELDEAVQQIVDREERRQAETIILIASESEAPAAVVEALGSTFGNIYAEGYPREESRQQTEAEITDIDMELAHYRRYSDPRYYKGVENADIIEALARRRAAELFAANGISANNLYVNVQPLSGAPANSAVYTALLLPGDTIMGLNLNDGGHLTHGSPVSRSGKVYKGVPYFVDPQTEVLDYDAIERIALEAKPKIIVAGYSAYPMVIDWRRFREIADKAGAYLLADIAHISGLVAAGVHPSPIGIADIVSTTTHKSLCGPRGAMLLTHKRDIARKLDRAVFPGEQGGPHVNNIAALAVALKLANTEQFRVLQQRIVDNAQRLAQQLQEHGIRVVGGGCENHLLLIDTKSVSHNGVHLTGDMGSRILDVAGIVVNRNTIPGDVGALSPTGIRMGTVWVSQLGFGPAEIDLLAEAIATVLKGARPYAYAGPGGKRELRARVDYQALRQGRAIVRRLRGVAAPAAGLAVAVRGAEAETLLNYALTSDVTALGDGQSQPTHLFGPDLDLDATLERVETGRYLLRFATNEAAADAAEWLQALSDGYAQFDDVYARLPGPVVAQVIPAGVGEAIGAALSRAAADVASALRDEAPTDDAYADSKPYFIGRERRPPAGDALPPFEWDEPADPPLLITALHETHKAMGARMVPFAGYDMPVWYSSVSEEHAAVREAAGLFDVSHMGVFDVSGPHAADLLNLVTTNDVAGLEVGQSHYTYFLLPDGSVVDDLMIYRTDEQIYMVVVNASNNDKDFAWLNAVNEGQVLIDADRPWARVQHPAVVRDLRDPRHGADGRVDIALQGPRAADILIALSGNDAAFAKRLKGLPWAGVMRGAPGGFDLVISRTGYTGERIAYELFIHPDRAVALWDALRAVGEPLGMKACGLAARDSTRTEAGLPLYGHELAGPHNLNPADAAFGSFVKMWKPFFIGRRAFVTHEEQRDRVIVRFRMNDKGVRRPEPGDPVLDRRGKVVGHVTSCAIDAEGYLLGQAIVPLSLREPGTALHIYQLGGGTRPIKAAERTGLGSTLPMPNPATVLTRFPERKK